MKIRLDTRPALVEEFVVEPREPRFGGKRDEVGDGAHRRAAQVLVQLSDLRVSIEHSLTLPPALNLEFVDRKLTFPLLIKHDTRFRHCHRIKLGAEAVRELRRRKVHGCGLFRHGATREGVVVRGR